MNVCVAHLEVNVYVAKNFGAWTERLATPALHLWRIRHGLVEELALCIKSLATPALHKSSRPIGPATYTTYAIQRHISVSDQVISTRNTTLNNS